MSSYYAPVALNADDHSSCAVRYNLADNARVFNLTNFQQMMLHDSMFRAIQWRAFIVADQNVLIVTYSFAENAIELAVMTFQQNTLHDTVLRVSQSSNFVVAWTTTTQHSAKCLRTGSGRRSNMSFSFSRVPVGNDATVMSNEDKKTMSQGAAKTLV